MAFPQNLLHENEELVLDLRPHWMYITPAAVLLAVAILIGLVSLAGPTALQLPAGLIVVAALGYFVYKYVNWTSTSFAVTNERVMFRYGVLTRQGAQIPLEKINSVDFRQGLLERLVGTGNLIIEAGSENSVESFRNIRKPLAVQQEINHQINEHDRRRWTPPAEALSGASGATSGLSVAEQLEKLADLRDRGALTDAEFQAEKAKLLNRNPSP